MAASLTNTEISEYTSEKTCSECGNAVHAIAGEEWCIMCAQAIDAGDSG